MRPFSSCRCDTRHRVGGHRRCIGIGSQLLSYRNNDVASLFGCWPFAQNSEIQAQPCVKEAGDRNAGWINILIRLGIVFPNLHWAVLASLSSLALIYCSKLTVVPFSVVFSCCDMLQIWQCSTGHLVVTSDSAIIFFFFFLAPEIHSLWDMTISVNSTDCHKHWNQPTRH